MDEGGKEREEGKVDKVGEKEGKEKIVKGGRDVEDGREREGR